MPKIIPPEFVTLSFGAISDSTAGPVEYVRKDLYDDISAIAEKGLTRQNETLDKLMAANQRVEDLSKLAK